MHRLMLKDEHWSKLRAIMCEHGIYDKSNLRKTVEGILYRMRTGLPWRDLPFFLADGFRFISNLIVGHRKEN